MFKLKPRSFKFKSSNFKYNKYLKLGLIFKCLLVVSILTTLGLFSYKQLNVKPKAEAATVPSAPTNVSATSSSGNAIKVTWTKPISDGGSPITDYIIEYCTLDIHNRCTDIYGDMYYTAEDGVNTETFTYISGMGSDPKLSIWVKAVNAYGVSTNSNSVMGNSITSSHPSTDPAPILTTITGNQTITLNWTSIKTYNNYRIKYQKYGDTDWKTIYTGNVLSYKFTELINQTTYNFSIQGIYDNNDINSRLINLSWGEGRASATPYTTPSKPTISNIANGLSSATIT